MKFTSFKTPRVNENILKNKEKRAKKKKKKHERKKSFAKKRKKKNETILLGTLDSASKRPFRKD